MDELNLWAYRWILRCSRLLLNRTTYLITPLPRITECLGRQARAALLLAQEHEDCIRSQVKRRAVAVWFILLASKRRTAAGDINSRGKVCTCVVMTKRDRKDDDVAWLHEMYVHGSTRLGEAHMYSPNKMFVLYFCLITCINSQTGRRK